MEGAALHRRLHDEAVEIPGPTITALCEASAEAGVTAVVGVTERDPGRIGTLYNTNVVVGPDGHAARQAPQARADLGRARRLGGRRRLHAVGLRHPARPAGHAELRRERQHARPLRAAGRRRAHPRRQLPVVRAARRPAREHERGVPARRGARLRGAALQHRQPGVRDPRALRGARRPVRGRGVELHLRRSSARTATGSRRCATSAGSSTPTATRARPSTGGCSTTSSATTTASTSSSSRSTARRTSPWRTARDGDQALGRGLARAAARPRGQLARADRADPRAAATRPRSTRSPSGATTMPSQQPTRPTPAARRAMTPSCSASR